MTTFIAACLAVIVLELAALIAVIALALWKVRDAARAVEVAAYRVDQEVADFGATLRSGWGQAVKGLFSAALRLFR